MILTEMVTSTLVINGNDYGTEVTTGRYDALNGLMLKGNGKGVYVRKLYCKAAFIFQAMENHS